MESEPTVFVVGDDQAVRWSLARLMASAGLSVETHSSGREFLDTYDPARPGCLVLDVRMAGMSELALQEELSTRRITIPVIIVTGKGNVATAVRALRAGAVDFIEKPFRDQVLLDRVSQAIEQDADARRDRARREDVAARLACLTPREREVTDLLVSGKTVKQIAARFGISFQAVAAHRSRVLEKMHIENVVDLVRLVLAPHVRHEQFHTWVE